MSATDPFAVTFSAAFGGSVAAIAPTITAITMTPVNTQRIGVAFTVRGTIQYAALAYSDDGGTMGTLIPETFAYSFVHPGFTSTATAQTLTVGVPGGVSVKSNAFKIVAR